MNKRLGLIPCVIVDTVYLLNMPSVSRQIEFENHRLVAAKDIDDISNGIDIDLSDTEEIRRHSDLKFYFLPDTVLFSFTGKVSAFERDLRECVIALSNTTIPEVPVH